ncbi:hypothetical protein DdX_11746 [Ditylenchus destructor]|uniref:Uncharacterized protein n=1 Tax=Ditylenchus destructor TaxID=166010 RepID=A0AAD4MYW2_9BILA|nr:hypothetical protein DdX_11746 [Ditylenchus destructor]
MGISKWCWLGIHVKGLHGADSNKWLDGTPVDFDLRPRTLIARRECIVMIADANWESIDGGVFRSVCKKPAGPVAVVNPTSANPAPSMPEPPKPNPTKRSCHKRRRHHHRHHKHY